jgi:pimeloyl-ACP methyl ester carboxylesterase
MPFYSNDNLKLFYTDDGAGFPLVLCHGFGQDSSAWIDPHPLLVQHFRVLAIDIRGCGRSEVPKTAYTLADVARDIQVLLRSLGIEKTHIAGFSMGGSVAQEFALAFGGQAQSLSLHSATPGGPDPAGDRWVRMRAKIIASKDAELSAETRIHSFFSPQFINEHEDRVDAFIRRELSNPHSPSPDGIRQLANADGSFDTRTRVRQIAVPTLITVGSQDRVTLPERGRFLHQQIKGSEFVVFDGAGHFPLYQCTNEFCTVSLGFLLKHTPK